MGNSGKNGAKNPKNGRNIEEFLVLKSGGREQDEKKREETGKEKSGRKVLDRVNDNESVIFKKRNVHWGRILVSEGGKLVPEAPKDLLPMTDERWDRFGQRCKPLDGARGDKEEARDT